MESSVPGLAGLGIDRYGPGDKWKPIWPVRFSADSSPCWTLFFLVEGGGGRSSHTAECDSTIMLSFGKQTVISSVSAIYIFLAKWAVGGQWHYSPLGCIQETTKHTHIDRVLSMLRTSVRILTHQYIETTSWLITSNVTRNGQILYNTNTSMFVVLTVDMYLLIYSWFHNGPVIGTKQQITDRAIARSVMLRGPDNVCLKGLAYYFQQIVLYTPMFLSILNEWQFSHTNMLINHLTICVSVTREYG